jgi:hypothetical protein
MKRLFFGLILACSSTILSAQAWEGAGDQKLQFGLQGSGNGHGLRATYDYGIHEMFSVGAGADLFLLNRNGSSPVFIYGRANFHLSSIIEGLPREWDIYPGANLGIIGDTFGFGIHAGVRYFFSPNMGVYGEFGNRNSLGLSLNW